MTRPDLDNIAAVPARRRVTGPVARCRSGVKGGMGAGQRSVVVRFARLTDDEMI
jgi:hypothetical protein